MFCAPPCETSFTTEETEFCTELHGGKEKGKASCTPWLFLLRVLRGGKRSTTEGTELHGGKKESSVRCPVGQDTLLCVR